MDPRYRFTIVISTLLIVWWLWVVLSTYLFGDTGLNGLRYQRGIVLIGLAALGGFGAVWLAYRLVLWYQNAKTGFEAAPTDEFGSAFTMANSGGKMEPYQISLSKFQPALIAPPLANPNLHPLEAELIGFLHGYRHFPVDLSKPDLSLYEDAMARWHSAKSLPGNTPWLRIAALALNLSRIHAYEERRTSAPWWQPFKRDTLSFKLRTEPRPGMSALLLSTLPAFRALGNTPEGAATQRAILTALRYYATPQGLPLNAGPLAAQVIEGLQRTALAAGSMDSKNLDELTPARRTELVAALPKLWLGVLAAQTPSATLNASATLYLGGQQTQGWLTLQALLQALVPQLEPTLRTTLQLWETTEPLTAHHPAWAHVLPLLQEAELILPQHLGVGAQAGTFVLEGESGTPWGPAVKLNMANPNVQPVVASWQSMPKGPAAELALQPEVLRARAQAQVQQLEGKVRGLF